MGKESWETTSGLLDDFTLNVAEAWFGEDEENDDERIYLFLRGLATDSDDGEESEDGKGEGEVGNGFKATPTPLAYVGGFVGGILVLGAVILAFRLLFAIPLGSTGDVDFSPAGALTRTTPVTSGGYAGSSSTLPSVLRSPFPVPQTDTPIILAVTCPAGTVQIATGDRVADTLCVRGVLVTGHDPAPTPTVAVTPTATPYVSALPAAGLGGDTITLTIGNYVSGETPCAEDAIFDHVTVECIHIDRIAPR